MRAVDVPFVPAFEPDGQALLPLSCRLSALHFFRPLPLNLRPFGRSTMIFSTVVPGLFTTSSKCSVTLFGLLLVPESAGLAVASKLTVLSGETTAWATPAKAREAD